jgi:hypothetical protein
MTQPPLEKKSCSQLAAAPHSRGHI